MAKLFPPLIEGSIPAFYSDINGTALTVPFSMNRAVSSYQVNGFILRLKTVQSGSYLFTSEFYREDTTEKIDDHSSVTFDLTAEQVNLLNIGQFYKCQIAYIDKKNEIGHYSTVGLVKFTTKPQVYIDQMSINTVNMHNYEYLGIYNQYGNDYTERVYSYNFKVWDYDGNLIENSGELLHNSQNDDNLYESKNLFQLNRDLEIDKSYYLQYTITTTNKMIVSSPRYRIMQKTSIDPEIKTELKATLNFNNGYIDLNLIGIKDEDGIEDPVTGGFLLSRASEDSNFTIWNEISRFKLAGQVPSRWLWRDYTVEQGKKYIYSLQQYNDMGLYSNRILSNEIIADFEDAFLFDGNRQLKIRYNPKVSSLKPNVLETKTDTIGSKHPFIFRNGQVYYREFPISGLISYQMDEENLFSSITDPILAKYRKATSAVTDIFSDLGEKITKERDFKMDVLEWLTNGKPKIFRSPTEGNFIVRLMNVSLTPNDTLGRMLHTFNCTAYEVADYQYKTLSEYNFIHLENPEKEFVRWETLLLAENKNRTITYKSGVLNKHIAYTVKIHDLMPGDYIYIITDPTVKFDTANQAVLEQFKIVIGVTGSYYIESEVPIYQIAIPKGVKYNGSITYSYYSILQNKFNKIEGIQIIDVPTHQFIGKHDIIKELTHIQYNGSWIKNPKVELVKFYNLYASKRFVDKAALNTNQSKLSDIYNIYALGSYIQVGEGFRPGYPDQKWITNIYYDPATQKLVNVSDYNNIVEINESPISLDETERYTWTDPGKLESLTIGPGIIAEVAYQVRIINYLIEEDDQWSVKPAKQEYLLAQQELDNLLHSSQPDLNDQELANAIEKARLNVKTKYNNFIYILAREQEAEREAEGLL